MTAGVGNRGGRLVFFSVWLVVSGMFLEFALEGTDFCLATYFSSYNLADETACSVEVGSSAMTSLRISDLRPLTKQSSIASGVTPYSHGLLGQ